MCSISFTEAKHLHDLLRQALLLLIKTLPTDIQDMIQRIYYSTHVLPACVTGVANSIPYRSKSRLLAWMCDIHPRGVRRLCAIPRRMTYHQLMTNFFRDFKILAKIQKTSGGNWIPQIRSLIWWSPNCSCIGCVTAHCETHGGITESFTLSNTSAIVTYIRKYCQEPFAFNKHIDAPYLANFKYTSTT
jgi:hypothetical protein